MWVQIRSKLNWKWSPLVTRPRCKDSPATRGWVVAAVWEPQIWNPGLATEGPRARVCPEPARDSPRGLCPFGGFRVSVTRPSYLVGSSILPRLSVDFPGCGSHVPKQRLRPCRLVPCLALEFCPRMGSLLTTQPSSPRGLHV